MTLAPEQIKLLDAPLSTANVKKNPRGFDYVESWHAEAEANRIFGFDGWSSVILETKCVHEGERSMSSGKGYGVSYTAIVRVTVDGVQRDGAGAGHGIDRDLGLAHEGALKEAASDAEKRALKTFGNQFGLALYDKTRENVTTATPGSPPTIKRLSSAQAKERGLDTKIKDQIECCLTHEELAAWDRDFDKHTAECPASWLDAIRNNVILQGEEISKVLLNKPMDDEYKARMAQ